MLKHYEDYEKPVYIYNSLTHILIETHKNIKVASEMMTVIITVLYGSISAKSQFKYKNMYCYTSYSNVPLQKHFSIGSPVNIIKKDNGTIIRFDSITEATNKLNVGRGIIGELVRGKNKLSSYIDNDNKRVYFTAKYDN